MYLSLPWDLFGFKKVPSPNGSALIQTDSPILRLPNELLDHIFSYLDGEKDLHSLCLTCRHVGNIARPRLYNHITSIFPSKVNLSSHDISRPLNLYRTVSSANYASFVTSFKFISPTCYYHVSHHSIFTGWWYRLSHTCDKIDSLLSAALEALPNLQVLKIECHACSTPTAERRHRYLGQLGTRKLKQLSFICRCTPEKIARTYCTLSAPCLQSIETLEWMHPHLKADETNETFQITEILPHLRTLKYDHNNLLDQLLSIRSIIYLSPRHWSDSLHRAVTTGAANGQLTWIHVAASPYEGVCLPGSWMHSSTKALATAIRKAPGAFRNITHLGGLCYHRSNPDEIIKEMAAFSVLPSLVSIEVVNRLHGKGPFPPNPDLVDPWKVELLRDLRISFPRLATVYIHGILWYSGSTVWTVWTFGNEWTSIQVKSYDTVKGTWES